MKSFIYFFKKFRTASVLNLAGLAIAFAAFFVFMTQVRYAYTFNRGLTDYENLYRLEVRLGFFRDEWNASISRPLAEEIKKLPQVEGLALYTDYASSNFIFDKDGTEIIKDASAMLTDAMEVLAPQLIDGSLKARPHELIIPRSFAEKYFDGEVMVAGRTLRNREGKEITVTGVYEDFPKNSILLNYCYFDMGDEGLQNWGNFNYSVLLRLNPNADAEEFNASLSEFVGKTLAEGYSGQKIDEMSEEDKKDTDEFIKGIKARITPVTETYFSGVNPVLDKGNRGLQLVLELACLLVILIAAINFANFALAESPMRIKGVNTRKVLGESLLSIRSSLIMECVITALIAAAISTLLIYIAGPFLMSENLVRGSLLIPEHWSLWGCIWLIAIAVGVIAGLYPAFYATSLPTDLALKGSFGLSPSGMKLRRVLVCVQLIVSMIMVTYIGILMLQSRYIYHSDYGYDKDTIVFGSLNNITQKDAIRTELLSISGIEDVSYASTAIGTMDSFMNWGRGSGDKRVTFGVMVNDYHYLNTLGIKIIEGRDFNEHDGDCYIINKAMKDKYDWIEVNKELTDNDLPVIGVCENVRFYTTRRSSATEPCAFIVFGSQYQQWGDPCRIIHIHIGKNVDKFELRRQCEKIIQGFNGNASVNLKFLDERLEHSYIDEFRFISQIEIFSFICVFITLIGVFCLTMFETEYRRKEIGIRKVLGSSAGEIISLFSSSYLWLIGISFVIATPVAWYFGNKWLQNFAEHTPIYWWIFPIALIVVAIIVLGTVIIQSWRVANANPVKSIKSE